MHGERQTPCSSNTLFRFNLLKKLAVSPWRRAHLLVNTSHIGKAADRPLGGWLVGVRGRAIILAVVNIFRRFHGDNSAVGLDLDFGGLSAAAPRCR